MKLSHVNVIRVFRSPVDHRRGRLEAGNLVMDTFYGASKQIYFNGEAIEIIHAPAAHTDGDSLVFFRGSDVVAAGGVVSTTSFPSFDPAQGGSVQGLIDGLNRILDITVAETRAQGGTIVISGHGRLYDETDVAEYRDMLTIVRDRVRSALDAGASLADVIASRPALDYAGVFGATEGRSILGGALKICVKSRSSPLPPPPPAGGLEGTERGALAAPRCTVPGDTSRMKPSASILRRTAMNLSSPARSNFAPSCCTVILPSIAARMARSPRDRKLVLPDASCTPLPVFE